MNLTVKQLKRLLFAADHYLSEPNSETLESFTSAFDEAELLENRLSQGRRISLYPHKTESLYRDNPLLSGSSSEMVFTAPELNLKVTVELERRAGSIVVTGQIILESDDQLKEIWAGAELEISTQGKVIAVAEINDKGEYETQMSLEGSVDFTIRASGGTGLEIRDIPIP